MKLLIKNIILKKDHFFFLLFLKVMRKRKYRLFFESMKKSWSKIENKIASHKLILEESSYFYHF